MWGSVIVVGVRSLLGLASRCIRGEWLHLPSSAAGGIESILFAAFLLLFPVYLFGLRRGGEAEDFGFVRFPFWRAMRLMALGWLVWLALEVPWALLMRHFAERIQPNMLKVFGGGWRGYLLALVCGGMIAPFAEETFFRGFLFAGLRQYYPFWISAGVSGLLFGFIHFMPAALLPLAAYGVMFAWLRERTGSIWPCIMAHMLVNSFGFTVAFVVELRAR